MAFSSENRKKVMSCVKTAPGLKRKENEDHFLVIDDHDKGYDARSLGMLFAVADGMGGHKGGAKASLMACEGLLDYYTDHSNSVKAAHFPKSRLRVLKKVIRRAHLKVSRYAQEKKGYERMGSTLSVLVLLNDIALIAHVGDSRIYRLRNNYLEKLTDDQTLTQLSVEMGYIEQEDAANHPMRYVLTNALGQGLDKVQTRIEEVQSGDIFLLCSDGLHHMVSADRIEKILKSFSAECSACDRLVQEALKRGGRDNITAIVVHL